MRPTLFSWGTEFVPAAEPHAVSRPVGFVPNLEAQRGSPPTTGHRRTSGTARSALREFVVAPALLDMPAETP